MPSSATRRPTLRDVAAAAGVSHQTVSRVINDAAGVLPETRERVMAVVTEVGYRPHAVARSMAQGHTDLLACLAPNLTDFTYASAMEGAQAIAREHGYYLLCAAVHDVADFACLIEQLAEYRRVDGVLVISPYLDDRLGHLPQHIPAVLLGGCARPDAHRLVYLDNYAAAVQATRHLLDLGHRRIAQITGPLTEDCVQARDTGYRETLQEAGLTVEPGWTQHGDWSATSGYGALRRLMIGSQPPTAVIAQNDRMAVGVIRAARELGLSVPQDLSVIGFDDMPLASYFDPPLTTMRQDTFALGQAAAGALIEALADPTAEIQHLRLAAELVVRRSTGPVS